MRTVFILLLLFSNFLFSQQYYVNATNLVVRSEPNKNSEKIGSLSQNEQITGIEETNNWVKINFNGQNGYVNKDYLSQNAIENVSQKNNSGILWLVFFIVSAIISLIVIFSRYNRKCEKCGKWGAMIKTDKIITYKTDSRVKKTLRKTDGKGKTIQTREIYIPATKFHYDVHRKCKNCGYEDIVCETETKQN